MRTDDESLATLWQMLAYKRPAWGKAEKSFIKRFLAPLGGTTDAKGNIIIEIGSAPVLWSCHTDTVHNDDGRQTIYLDRDQKNHVFSDADCLGADDTAGIWLMTEMIRAEKPGRYVFHRAEEVGGIGSTFIARHNKDVLKGIDIAIALDRKGTSSIITHQSCGRCCSDDFALSFAKALGGGFEPDDTGTFTDTANYVDDIAECTNLSVGYYHQHTKNEYLDVSFLQDLRDRLVTLDYGALTVKRRPGELDPADRWFGSAYGSGSAYASTRRSSTRPSLWDEWEIDDIERLVELYPRQIAELLNNTGWTAGDIRWELGIKSGTEVDEFDALR